MHKGGSGEEKRKVDDWGGKEGKKGEGREGEEWKERKRRAR